MQHLQPNTHLQGGRYKIVRFLSRGGFGNTYEALDVNLDKRVAIKEFFVKDFCLRESDTTLMTISATGKKALIEHLKKKFIEEARAIAKMEHENIVKVQALFEENGTAYYVMDYIDGESLSTILKRRGSLSEKEAVAIILKVADALGYMHKQNRFHLDVKPANIMLRNDGKVILIDFGSSKQYAELDGENTTTLAPCYTAGYAPSEQMNPKPTTFTAATDVYSLGATLYKMLTGQTPPSAIDLMNDEKILSPLPDEVSQNVKDCVEKAMIPQRSKRLQSVEEFVKMIIPVVDDYRRKCTILSIARKYRTTVTFAVVAFVIFVAGMVGNFIYNRMTSSLKEQVTGVTFKDVDGKEFIYTGEIADGTPNGNGMGDYFNGTYVGTYKNGVRHGEGKFESKDGSDKYDGSFYNDKYAKGRLTLSDGSYYEGTFVKDKPYTGTWYYKDGKVDCNYVGGAGEDNGHECVDLGVSVKWATCNIGANSPKEFGSFFAWAELIPKTTFYWKNYFDSEDSQGKQFRHYYNNGGKTCIDTSERTDAARQLWGGDWRIPSYEEMQELVKRCTWTQTTISGVNGYEVKGPNGKSFFLPATGWRWGTTHAYQGVGADYWTNSLDKDDSSRAHNLHFEGTAIGIYSIERYMGRVIRPVIR